MILFTDEIVAKLIENGRASAAAIDRDGNTPDHVPVVKIFNPCGAGTWLITECDPDEPDRLYGLCGLHEFELGYVLRSELEGFRNCLNGLGLERDLYAKFKKTLSGYADEARTTGDLMV